MTDEATAIAKRLIDNLEELEQANRLSDCDRAGLIVARAYLRIANSRHSPTEADKREAVEWLEQLAMHDDRGSGAVVLTRSKNARTILAMLSAPPS